MGNEVLEYVIEKTNDLINAASVSYTHLDVYKRQPADFAADVDSTKYKQDIANGKVGFVLDGGSDCIKAYRCV